MKSLMTLAFQSGKAILPALAALLLVAGCIPSAPETQPAPPPASTAAKTAPVATETPAKPSVQAEAVSKDAAGQPRASLKMDTTSASNANVSVEAIKDSPGFNIRGTFDLTGTIVPTGAGKWKLSGQFSVAEPDFAVGVPVAASMGTFSPTGTGMAMDASVVIITIPVRPPAAKAAEGSAPRTLPFSLDFDAPEKAQFTVCLTQM